MKCATAWMWQDRVERFAGGVWKKPDTGGIVLSGGGAVETQPELWQVVQQGERSMSYFLVCLFLWLAMA